MWMMYGPDLRAASGFVFGFSFEHRRSNDQVLTVHPPESLVLGCHTMIHTAPGTTLHPIFIYGALSAAVPVR